jgi:hypothetical protein
VADMNDDGRRDLVLGQEPESLHIFAGNGNLTFRAPVTLTTGAWPHGGLVADFNGDGRRDAAVANRYDRHISVFRNDGGLSFTPLPIPIDRSATDITARDLDGDARLDLVVSARSRDDGPWEDGFVYVFRGNGDATFGGATIFETMRGPQSVVVGDFTHDGITDVATTNHSYSYVDVMCGPSAIGPDTLSILPGTGGLAFGPPITFALWPQTIDPQRQSPREVVRTLNTSDLNRDRFPDLIVGFARVLLTVGPRANRRPTVSAGPDQTQFIDLELNVRGGGTDPDGHFLTFSWSSNRPGEFSRPEADACYFPDDYGVHTVTLTGTDNHGGVDTDSAVLTFVRGNDAPTVSVLRPIPEEVLTLGSPYTIRWEASDFDGIADIDVVFSPTGGVGGSFEPIAECTNLPGTATECTWANPRPLTENGYIHVFVTDTTGLQGGSSSGRFTIANADQGDRLPPGWANVDVGAVGAAGSASFASGVYTVRGSGADIWDRADEFHFAYTVLNGDFDISTRVVSVQNVHLWTKAGLMIRGWLGADGIHGSVFATPTTERGVAFQRRPQYGGLSVHTDGPAIAPPVWLRLTRRDVLVTAFYRTSATGPWIEIGSESILAAQVYVGFAVGSHVDGRLATARFDNLRIVELPASTTSAAAETTERPPQ